MAAERLVVLNPGDELYPTAGKPTRNAGSRKKNMPRRRRKATSSKPRRSSKATPRKRNVAAKKAAATRKRNAAKRSASAKKAARTRKRRATSSIARRRNPRRTTTTRKRTAASRKRTTAASRKRNPSRKRRTTSRKRKTTRRRSTGLYRHNPATMKGFVESLKTAAQVGMVLLPLRAIINYIGAWPTKSEGEGDAKIVTQTFAQQVGPLYDVGISALALYAVPRFILKGKMARYRTAGTAALHANLILSSLQAIAWYGRRGWDAKKAPIDRTSDEYPRWTDYISFPEPQAKSDVKGAPYYRRSIAGPRFAGTYQPSLGRGRSSRSLVYNTGLGRYVEAGGY